MHSENCDRKKRYDNEQAAQDELDRIRDKLESGYWHKDDRPKTERRVYWCWDCRGWHLTSQRARPVDLFPKRRRTRR